MDETKDDHDEDATEIIEIDKEKMKAKSKGGVGGLKK
jgi:hypothetical protein